MSTDRLADVMVRIAEPVERIGSDEMLIDKLRALAQTGRKTAIENAAAMVGTLVPVLLERRREDTYTILAALTGKTAEEIAAQPAMVTLKEARESIDADFLRFFGWSVSTADAK
jgi:hypothetical protein